jgi:hypothetical protein
MCLFEGVRQWAASGALRNALLLSSFGLVFMLVHIGYSYWVHKYQIEILSSVEKGLKIPELSVNWGNDMPPESRASGSLELARVAFFEHGRLHHYFDKSGERMLFAPAASDLQERERKVASVARLEASAEDTKDVPLRLVLSTALVAFIGYGFGRAQAKSANPSIKTDTTR